MIEALIIDPVFALGLRGAIALVLLAAAFHKLRHWDEFKSAIIGFELAPAALVLPLGICLTILEIAFGVSLLLLPLGIASAFGASGIFSFYATAMGIALLRGKHQLDCGCGGLSQSQQVSWSLVVRNMMLAGAAVLLATPASLSTFGALDWGTTAFIAMFAAAAYAAADTLLANRMMIKTAEANA